MNTENTALQTILSTPIVYNVTEEALGIIESNWETVPDCHERENYEIVRKGISEIVGLRGDIERRRKAKKKDALEYGRKVDKAAQAIISRLSSVENRLKTAKGEIDEEKRLEKEQKKEEERERIAALESKVQQIRDMSAIQIEDTSETLRERAVQLDNVQIDDDEFQEFTGKAIGIKITAAGELHQAANKMAAREKREAEERAELERQREAQKVEAERLKKLEQERKEQERIAVEERAERERIEAEKRAKEEALLAEERKKLEEDRRRAAAEQAERGRAERAKLEEDQRLAQAELESQRQLARKAEIQRRKEEEERQAKERAEIEAERQRIAEEQALIDQENRHREEERQAKERAAKEEEELRINEKLQAKRFKEIVVAIGDAASIPVAEAKFVTKAIVSGEIPHVRYVG